MARDDWSGTSGWGAIADPTGLLSGNVLVAGAGITQVSEDYLLKVPSTGGDFSKDNYSVTLNYAFPTYIDSTTMNNMSLGLIARASAFGTDAAVAGLTVQKCYIGRLNLNTGEAEILKRDQVVGIGGVDTKLQSAIIPDGSFEFGVLHTLAFKCSGDSTTGTQLQLTIDGQLAVDVGDNAATMLTTGFSGIQVMGGTAYADNFTVLGFTNSGTADIPAYAGWIPTDDITSADLVLWVKSDTGITERVEGADTMVTTWDDQSGNNNHLSQASNSLQPTYISSSLLNGSKPVKCVRFKHTAHQFLKAAYSSELNLNSNGTGITAFFLSRAYQTVIGDDTDGASTIQRAPLLNCGRSYQLELRRGAAAEADPNQVMFFNNAAVEPSSDSSIFGISLWEISGYTNGGAGAANMGFFKNGTSWSTTAANIIASSTDMSNSPDLRIAYRPNIDTTPPAADYAYGSFDLVEVILVDRIVTQSERQKIEGYFAWKYDLAVNLPASHPYRNAAP